MLIKPRSSDRRVGIGRVTDLHVAVRGEGTAPAIRGTNFEGVLALARRLHRDGQSEAAIDLCRRLARDMPERPEAPHLLGLLLHDAGDHRNALRWLRRVRAAHAESAEIHRDMGEVYRSMRRYRAAIASLEASLRLAPEDPDTHFNLGHAHLEEGRPAEAEMCYRRALALDPTEPDHFLHLGVARAAQGDDHGARAAYLGALALSPNHPEAGFLLRALDRTGAEPAPPDYVRALFNGVAPRFERHLVETLGYDAPRRLRAMLDAHVAPAWRARRAVDLGCGTGLTGRAIADRCDHLTGVDLAEGMLSLADSAGSFDELVLCDVNEYLEAVPDTLDLVVASDLFLYTGDLHPTVAFIAGALKAGGVLIGSVELLTGAQSQCLLQPCGRFAHSIEHVRSAARQSGLTITAIERGPLRREGTRMLTGAYFLLRRPD